MSCPAARIRSPSSDSDIRSPVGMKAGTVIDLAAAEAAVRQAVDLAERSAKLQLQSVIVSVSAGRPSSELISASIEVANSAISDREIARVLSAGSRYSIRESRAVLHSLPIGYVVDNAYGIRDPRGMLARKFGIDMHVATTDVSVARNLMLARRALPPQCRGDGGEPLCGGALRSCRRRSRPWRRGDRHGRWHDHDRRVQRRAVHPCGRLCTGRPRT